MNTQRQFTESTETKIIGYFFSDGDLDDSQAQERLNAAKLLDRVPSATFNSPYEKELFVTLKEYYKTYGVIPKVSQFRQVLKDRFKAAPEKYHIYEGALTRCLMRLQADEIKYIRDNLETVVRNTLMDSFQKKVKKVMEEGKDLTPEFCKELDVAFAKVTSFKVQSLDNIEYYDNIDKAMAKNHRQTISTGIDFIDYYTKGGLAKKEIGLILAQYGLGKTTILTKIANSAYQAGHNVLHIVFEDQETDIKRKHAALFSELSINDLDDAPQQVMNRIRAVERNRKNKLFIVKLPSGEYTVPQIRQLVRQILVEKGVKIDLLVLDYIDCLISHIGTGDANVADKIICRAIENMASQEDICIWGATQGNRSSFNQGRVTGANMGGSVAKAQIFHTVFTFGKTEEQEETNDVTMHIDKNRHGKSKITQVIHLNNGTLEIISKRGYEEKVRRGVVNSMPVFDIAPAPVQLPSGIVEDDFDFDNEPRMIPLPVLPQVSENFDTSNVQIVNSVPLPPALETTPDPPVSKPAKHKPPAGVETPAHPPVPPDQPAADDDVQLFNSIMGTAQPFSTNNT